ncbi:MAG: M3 family metallopeptidase [Myxococcaceae bacterium]
MTAKTNSEFTRAYLQHHLPKEELFWTTYMGTEPDAKALEQAELRYKSFTSDPLQLEAARAALAALPADASALERTALTGWSEFFAANCVEGDEAQRLQKEILQLESELFERRAKLRLTYRDPAGEDREGTTNTMASNIAAASDEGVRKSSHEALLRLEQWVLENGYLELVKRRNAFGRARGFANYFDCQVMQKERMPAARLRAVLDEFEQLTRESCFGHLEWLAREKGPEALAGHNVRFAVGGDVEQKLDPYLPFATSLERWYRSFANLGIGYRGATLTLDLFDRRGKYENGFMHGVQPCYFEQGRWVPARINFTSNATPNQLGSGRRGLITLFHEGGHAAHFSNITMNAPCFSQEYPPTSMAYAETQSKFCDSLISDADWLALYAVDRGGQRIPRELIERFVVSDQPFRPFQERSLLLVPVFESRLYALPDEALTAANVTALARRCEKEILGTDSPRPLLAIPHLLGGESACSYQGYLLAQMAVYQTRAHFEEVYGFLTDNARIGPDLARAYWNPGNSISHGEGIARLTGKPLSGRMLADSCNLSTAARWRDAARSIREAEQRGKPAGGVVADLDAKIRIVHGAEHICSNEQSAQALWEGFETWIGRHYPR